VLDFLVVQFVSLLIAAGVFEIISFSRRARCSSAHFSAERSELKERLRVDIHLLELLV
jgi:hypothetical protein